MPTTVTDANVITHRTSDATVACSVGDVENCSENQNCGDLRAAADRGQLYRGADQAEGHHQHGIANAERAELPAKGVRYQEINHYDQEPVERGIEYGGG